MNLPICLVALVLAWRGLPKDTASEHVEQFDGIGLLLLSPALVLIFYGLAQVGTHHGFGHSVVLTPLLIGVALMIAFVIYALRAVKTPIIDLGLFKVGSFTVSSVLLFLSGLFTYGAMLLLPIYYQQVRGEGILTSRLLLPPTIRHDEINTTSFR